MIKVLDLLTDAGTLVEKRRDRPLQIATVLLRHEATDGVAMVEGVHLRDVPVEGASRRLAAKSQRLCDGAAIVLNRADDDAETVVGGRLNGWPIAAEDNKQINKTSQN